MSDSIGRFLPLWEASPIQNCRQSCYCPLPEHCREITPEQYAIEVKRREDAGWVETHTPRGSITVIDWALDTDSSDEVESSS